MRKTYVSELWHSPMEGVYHPYPGSPSYNGWKWISHDPSYCSYAESLAGSTGPGWHSCSHYKCVTQHASGPTWTDGQYDTGPTATWWEYRFTGYAAAVGACADADVESVSESQQLNLLDLHSRALRAILPAIKTQMSLPNSIYELKDYRALERTGSRILRALRKLRRDGLNKFSTLRSILRSGADIFLQEQFNVNPLVRDIFTLWKCLKSAGHASDSIFGNAGKIFHRHYQVSIKDLYPEVDLNYKNFPCSEGHVGHAGYFGNPNIREPGGAQYVLAPCSISGNFTGALSRYRRETCVGAKYTLTVEFSYKLSSSGKTLDRLATLADSLGVNLNPSIIWNAIPWSFVVDWVLGVSQYLSTFKVSWVRPMVQIHRCCWSIKKEFEIEYSFSKAATAHVPGVPRTTCVRKRLKLYDRVVGVPSRGRLLYVDKLDTEEYILSAALILAR